MSKRTFVIRRGYMPDRGTWWDNTNCWWSSESRQATRFADENAAHAVLLGIIKAEGIVGARLVRIVAREPAGRPHPGIHAAWAALENERKEHAATQELHSRAGSMMIEALGMNRRPGSGWLWENLAADIRRLTEERDSARKMLAKLSEGVALARHALSAV